VFFLSPSLQSSLMACGNLGACSSDDMLGPQHVLFVLFQTFSSSPPPTPLINASTLFFLPYLVLPLFHSPKLSVIPLGYFSSSIIATPCSPLPFFHLFFLSLAADRIAGGYLSRSTHQLYFPLFIFFFFSLLFPFSSQEGVPPCFCHFPPVLPPPPTTTVSHLRSAGCGYMGLTKTLFFPPYLPLWSDLEFSREAKLLPLPTG